MSFRIDFEYQENQTNEKKISDGPKYKEHARFVGKLEGDDPVVIKFNVIGSPSRVEEIVNQMGAGPVGSIITSRFKTLSRSKSFAINVPERRIRALSLLTPRPTR